MRAPSIFDAIVFRMIRMIAAIGRNRELGKGNDLLWKIPDDLKRFKELTRGHPIVMGRKTYESLPVRPLPGRTNIVITRQNVEEKYGGEPSVTCVGSWEEALRVATTAAGADEIFVIGGAQIYAMALEYADVLHLTQIDAEAPDADTFFPAYEHLFGREIYREERRWEGLRYAWVDLAR